MSPMQFQFPSFQPPDFERGTWSVSELTDHIKEVLELDPELQEDRKSVV